MASSTPSSADGALMIATVIAVTGAGLALVLWATAPGTGDVGTRAALALNAIVALAAIVGGTFTAWRGRRTQRG